MQKSSGLILAFFGLGGFILPFFGIQFRILNILGGFQWVVAFALIVIGAVILVKGE